MSDEVRLRIMWGNELVIPSHLAKPAVFCISGAIVILALVLLIRAVRWW